MVSARLLLSVRLLLSAPALAGLTAGSVAAAPAPANPAIGCPSLANLRMLLAQSRDDPATAAATLADDRGDHLGCALIPRDTIAAVSEHLALNGKAYDCLTLRTTSICHWVVAGTVTLPEAGAKPRPGEKGRAPDRSPSPEKNRR